MKALRSPRIAWPCIAVDSASRRLLGSSTLTVPDAAAAAAMAFADAGNDNDASSRRGATTAVVATGSAAAKRGLVLEVQRVVEDKLCQVMQAALTWSCGK